MEPITISISPASNRLDFGALDQVEHFGQMYHGTLSLPIKTDDPVPATLDMGDGYTAVIAGAVVGSESPRYIIWDRGLPALPTLDLGHPKRQLWTVALAEVDGLSFRLPFASGYRQLFGVVSDGERHQIVLLEHSLNYYRHTDGSMYVSQGWGDVSHNNYGGADYLIPPDFDGFFSSSFGVVACLDVTEQMRKMLGGLWVAVGGTARGYWNRSHPRFVCAAQWLWGAEYGSPALSQVLTPAQCLAPETPTNALVQSEQFARALLSDDSETEQQPFPAQCGVGAPAHCTVIAVGWGGDGSRHRVDRYVVGARYGDVGQVIPDVLIIEQEHEFTNHGVELLPLGPAGRRVFVQSYSLTQQVTCSAEINGMTAQALGQLISTWTQTGAGGSHVVSVDGIELLNRNWAWGELSTSQSSGGIEGPASELAFNGVDFGSGASAVLMRPIASADKGLYQMEVCVLRTAQQFVEYFRGPLATPFGLDAGWQRSGNLWGANDDVVGETFDPAQNALLKSFVQAVQNPITGEVKRNTLDARLYSFV